MFLYDYWYVAARQEEVGEQPIARTFLNHPVVLYRLADGTPVALEDRCVHRRAPLSMGRLVGDTLECAYHGLSYDRSGTCVRVPGQMQVPPGASVRSYPLVDKFNWTWIWMGDPAKADPALIPDIPWGGMAGWSLVHDLLPVRGDYRLLIDNLMDLSHLAYLHRRTIGVDDASLTAITSRRTEDGVMVERWAKRTEVPPMVARASGMTTPIDRWQKCFYTPPSTILIDVGIIPSGADPSEAVSGRGTQAWVINLITPETERTTHYFWGHARNYAVDKPEVDAIIHREVSATFDEDIAIISGQQARFDAEPDAPVVDINADGGPLQTRRLMERLMEEEQAARGEAA